MIFKRSLSAAAFAMFIAGAASADTSSINTTLQSGTDTFGIVENDFVRAGINGLTGTFGSGGNTSPGLLFDSTGTGTFNTAYDYLTPGSPFDGFAVKIDGTNLTNNNSGTKRDITGMLYTDTNLGLLDGTDTITWESNGERTDFEIKHVYTLGSTTPYIDITTTITMKQSATSLSFGRFIDPDARAADGDSSSTDNVLGYGVIPDSNIAFSEALSSRYALGLYSTDTNVDAGIQPWSSEADAYTENAFDETNTNTGDNTIGLSWNWSDLSAGDILTASYAYIFGPSAFEAAEDALTGGAGGGDTTTTDSWGTLEDVGSATDAASTSTPVITYSDPVVDTGRPVLEASITTHTSVIGSDTQTIKRETTTTTTTPMEIITYTDGVETARTDTTSAITIAVTDPGSFVGRIDQIDSAADAMQQVTRGLVYNNVSGIGSNHDFDNGMTGRTTGGIFGSTATTDGGNTIYGGIARMSTDLDGNGDSITADTTGIGFGFVNNADIGSIGLNVKYHRVDLEYTRTIGDFDNAGKTSGTDRSASITFVGNGETVRPVIGYTVNQRSLDSFVETGSIQSRLAGLDYDATNNYATIGGELSLGILDITALRHTDGVNQLTVGIEKSTESMVYNISAERTQSNLGDSTGLRAGLRFNF